MYFEELGLPIAIAMVVASVLFLSALGLALWRIVNGPTMFDRVVALELVSGICLGIIIMFAIHFDQQVLMEAAFAIALIGFLGTVAFARYLERGGGK
ncbi:monovalent cation/H+ antiporter complex subunit F [Rubellicoccus peritrichatus]|uniref:Monovalent cation/H+ antiporter complex subunit F n=1 Tax=Rubellicoccus peritrichatus TaxID=3080537 RepID=A0AAQ3QUF8_9BACT|nr:monovalent cation/H+ antiporter complex subunit F [Puniceicoccus sp. CR14]WOO39885.1 monovalent cation/H+ antiporter complex subunit F [Puniceicoccus sp. CR14]